MELRTVPPIATAAYVPCVSKWSENLKFLKGGAH